jgi:uncharacterized protein
MTSQAPLRRLLVVSLIGFGAGLASGLLGVGGGIVMVPLLVALAHFSQHEAHATSLLAILPIAFVGALVYGNAGEADFAVGALLTAGSLFGAPIGARIMADSSEATLRIGFGCLMVAAAVVLVLP